MAKEHSGAYGMGIDYAYTRVTRPRNARRLRMGRSPRYMRR